MGKPDTHMGISDRDLVSPLREDAYKADLASDGASRTSKADLGPIGIWTPDFDALPVCMATEAAAELEDLGCSAIWLPEISGRDPFAHLALLLHQTTTLVGVTGIAVIWARDPVAMKAGACTLAGAYPGRFVLGLGVSHDVAVDEFRGSGPNAMAWQRYEKPVTAMTRYLDTLDRAPFLGHQDVAPYPTVLAALGPKLLGLAATRTDGAHTYFVPPEHTAQAREVLGPEPLLVVEQAALVETDPERARDLARKHAVLYLSLANFRNNLLRLGFTEDDVAPPYSDRLVDAIVAWGSLDQVIDRARQHFDAGADHVCIQPVHDGREGAFMAQCRTLYPALAEAFGTNRHQAPATH
jgi:probable F420-dependent oxidoreductase